MKGCGNTAKSVRILLETVVQQQPGFWWIFSQLNSKSTSRTRSRQQMAPQDLNREDTFTTGRQTRNQNLKTDPQTNPLFLLFDELPTHLKTFPLIFCLPLFVLSLFWRNTALQFFPGWDIATRSPASLEWLVIYMCQVVPSLSVKKREHIVVTFLANEGDCELLEEVEGGWEQWVIQTINANWMQNQLQVWSSHKNKNRVTGSYNTSHVQLRWMLAISLNRNLFKGPLFNSILFLLFMNLFFLR